MDFTRVCETNKEPFFTVKHKLLSIPREDYEKVLKSYTDPYTSQGAQEFVSMYLAFHEDPGIVGLVGLEQKAGQVLIDAAVRYDNGGNN